MAARSETGAYNWVVRFLPWIGGIVLAAGTLVFLVATFRSNSPDEPLPPAPAQNANPQAAANKAKDVPPEIRRVAVKFLMTAVSRKQLEESWEIVHPTLKQGYTLAQWKKGDIPVQPFPVGTTDQVRYLVVEVYPRQVMLEVALIPKAGSKGYDATAFWLGMKAVGNGEQRRWLVDYWMPHWNAPVRMGQGP